MYKKLEIKNPCSQKWEEMLPLGTGRYCNSCDHLIHDFSKMSQAELVNMLQSGKYKCGRFTEEQMGTLYYEKDKISIRKKYWSAIAASIVAGTLQLSMGFGQTQTEVKKNAPVVDRSIEEKFFNEKPEDKSDHQQQTSKEKFSFRIVDAATKQPLEKVFIEVMGVPAYTDSLGRVDIELEYQKGENKSVNVRAYLYGYNEEIKILELKNCIGRLTELHLRKKKENKREKYLVGVWG